ncbi:type I restriction endonuclease subunit R [Chloroflexota bacterium]
MTPAEGNDYSEDTLIEQPTIALFHELGWETANCFYEFEQSDGSPLGRENRGQVVLESRLGPVLERLNPGLPDTAYGKAIDELTRDRSIMSPAQANRDFYKLLKDGVKVITSDTKGIEATITVKVMDWEHPENNDFFLASQFWVTGEMYTRRADLVGFVNGLPLVFIELKAVKKQVEDAYNDNLRDYKDTIPHIFWYNAFIILSNGTDSKIGSMTAAWEHFVDWKKISSEGDEGIVSLETMIRGTCQPERLLDLIENFILFQEAQGGLIKIIAKNHQYLGVNNTLEALKEIRARDGKLGVFWHTQGSGKSISMVFFAQKVLRKVSGKYTFVVVTDRKELDGQIYKNFASTGAVTEKEAHAESSVHLRRLLSEDHRYVFTLIQKFLTPLEISTRSDIIVITDEAHRSQYDTLAMNMRSALPKASFIAFTGTPLMVGEEKTRLVFGDYVSIYNFKQSVDDKATVPLYYENRIPELQLTNKDLNDDIYEIIAEAELDENQEKKLEREFSHQYHLITRDDRLETIAQDVVKHFFGRGFQGKSMVVSIDKATAVKMYDKVQKYWKKYIDELNIRLSSAPREELDELKDSVNYVKETDMAVVVSQSQNEIADMKKKGLDIKPHRERMHKEDLDTKFKDPDDPFRIVFVCAMWMTGFDVPSCSTIYLDKPMRNHTLMQTMARANRVFKDKVNGLIVDYVGVFRNIQKALAIYGSGGGIEPGDTPVLDKQALVQRLRQSIAEVTVFLREKGIKPDVIIAAQGFNKAKLVDDATDAVLANDETKQHYLTMVVNVDRLYKAILPDPQAGEFSPYCVLFSVIASKIQSSITTADISGVLSKVDNLLNHSVTAQGYVIRGPSPESDPLVDLSQIDFEKLRAKYEQGRKHIETERLRAAISSKLTRMVQLNRNRMDYLRKLQEMIDEYNTGSVNIDEFFKQLVDFTRSLNHEEKRYIAEGLTEEELALFDYLTKPDMKLSSQEVQQVKKVARNLLNTLTAEKLVLDWRKKQQSRADVKVTIEKMLDQLPGNYTRDIYEHKCSLIYQHVYESYYGQGQSVYLTMAR